MKPEMLASPTMAADNGVAEAHKCHVMEAGKGVWDVIADVARSGHQEEAFYILDLGDVVRKHKEWKLKLPRVQPFYGKLSNPRSFRVLVWPESCKHSSPLVRFVSSAFPNVVLGGFSFSLFVLFSSMQPSSATITATCWRCWLRWEPISTAPPRYGICLVEPPEPARLARHGTPPLPPAPSSPTR